MSGELEPRASDADRERVALVLRDAMVEGRLTLDEFAARLEQAYDAKTTPQLEALTRDLPAPAARHAARAGCTASSSATSCGRAAGACRAAGSSSSASAMPMSTSGGPR